MEQWNNHILESIAHKAVILRLKKKTGLTERQYTYLLGIWYVNTVLEKLCTANNLSPLRGSVSAETLYKCIGRLVDLGYLKLVAKNGVKAQAGANGVTSGMYSITPLGRKICDLYITEQARFKGIVKDRMDFDKYAMANTDWD